MVGLAGAPVAVLVAFRPGTASAGARRSSQPAAAHEKSTMTRQQKAGMRRRLTPTV